MPKSTLSNTGDSNRKLTNTEKTLKRYMLRGQLQEIYALNPNPRLEGRSLGYIVSQPMRQPPLKDGAKDCNGWQIAPSTKLLKKLFHGS